MRHVLSLRRALLQTELASAGTLHRKAMPALSEQFQVEAAEWAGKHSAVRPSVAGKKADSAGCSNSARNLPVHLICNMAAGTRTSHPSQRQAAVGLCLGRLTAQ